MINRIRNGKKCLQSFRRDRAFSAEYSGASGHLGSLRSLLGDEHVIVQDIEKYTSDWTGHYRGGSAVAFPSCTEELSRVMKMCHEKNIAVVVQGGNTGLVGGSVGFDNELIISTSRMNHIYGLDSTAGIIVCDAGVVLEDANAFAMEQQFQLPIDLGSKGSCMIGGCVSTNAGGLRAVKYGNFHGNVVGLECVLADGTVLDMLREVQKDNTGYHLKHLFIGSEGTLGIISKVALKVRPLPTHTTVVLAKLSSFDAVPTLLRNARMALGETLSAFEYMDGRSIAALAQEFPTLSQKFCKSIFSTSPKGASFSSNDTFVLIEASSNASEYVESSSFLQDNMQMLLQSQIEIGSVADAVISQDVQQESDLWKIREMIPVALANMSKNHLTKGPFLLKYDISIPLVETNTVVEDIEKYLSVECGHKTLQCSTDLIVDSLENSNIEYVLQVFCFGHAGDQNLHLNVILSFQKDLSETKALTIKNRVKRDLEHIVLSKTIELNGSISAEHGIGRQKSHLLEKCRHKPEVEMMKTLKKTLDPKCILNPGKILTLSK